MTVVEQPVPVTAKTVPAQDLLKPRQRFAAFDGMRALAVLLVMVGHAGFEFHGFIGVDIFFVLSGFLITSILLDELDKTGRIGFKNFYMRRVLRLLPALLLMLVLFLITSAVLKKSMKSSFAEAGIVLGYAANWVHIWTNRPNYLAHCWSLSIEEQFYILWPLIVLGLYWLLGRSRAAATICLLAAIGIVCYRHWMNTPQLPDSDPRSAHQYFRIYFGLDTHGDDLLAGSALAFWIPQIPRLFAFIVGWAGTLFLSSYVLLWGLNITSLQRYENFGKHPYAYIWIGVLAMLVGLLNDPRGLLSRLLSFKPLAWIGVISYGLYLFHYPIRVWVAERMQRSDPKLVLSRTHWIILAVELPLAFLIATVSFYALERPCLRLKERFRSAKPPMKTLPTQAGEVRAAGN